MSPVNSRLPLIRLLGLALVLALGRGTDAGASGKSRNELTAIMDHAPDPQLVPEGEELKTAEQMAARTKNAIAYLGIGESMKPLYASHTAVVVVPIEYGRIRKGMALVYVNGDGRRVAHCVVGKTSGGYLVRGVRNDEADPEVVNEDNLIGVIVQAYASVGNGNRHQLTLEPKGKDRLTVKKPQSKSSSSP